MIQNSCGDFTRIIGMRDKNLSEDLTTQVSTFIPKNVDEGNLSIPFGKFFEMHDTGQDVWRRAG
jgi:hypothetical protein